MSAAGAKFVGVHSVTLYCSDSVCDAVFEAEGSLDAVAAAICPFCGCTLAELTCAPAQTSGEDDADQPLEELELWIVHGPAGRRLRRRRRALKKQLRAAA